MPKQKQKQTNPRRFKIELDEKHAHVINHALEIYSRLCMGQMDSLTNVTKTHIDIVGISLIKKILFPELHNSSYYSIGSRKYVDQYARIAFDIYCEIRRQLSTNHKPGCYCICHDIPMNYGDYELIKVEEIK